MPQYSPDGEKVAFVSHSSGAGEIWVCDRDGANLVQLTSARWPETMTPRWSPDGSQIVFQARPEGPGDIFTIPSGGGAPRRVTDDPADDRGPVWSRDGRWIYFTSTRSGRYEIWKGPSAGGTAVQVARNGGVGPSISPDGRHVYYLRDAGELWRTDLESGDESRLLPSVSDWSRFAVTNHGIYFHPARPVSGGAPFVRVIDFLDFATGTIESGVRLDKAPFIGMTVSADERWLLLSQNDQTGADLMLVEDFR